VIREEPSGPADTPEICRKRTDLPLAGLRPSEPYFTE
jgi:hypothetical protein